MKPVVLDTDVVSFLFKSDSHTSVRWRLRKFHSFLGQRWRL
jgi:hypothetical protein